MFSVPHPPISSGVLLFSTPCRNETSVNFLVFSIANEPNISTLELFNWFETVFFLLS